MEFFKLYGDMFKSAVEHPGFTILFLSILALKISMPYTEKRRARRKSEEKIHQQNKLPDKSLLSKKAHGVILGRARNGDYVRVNVSRDSPLYNGLIVGGAGVGKTSTLLMCTQLANSVSDHPFTSIVVDPKREQYRTVPGKKNLCLDPTDRSTWGYDPYYKLNSLPHASADIQIEEFSRIARALIVEKDPKSSYWVNNARDLLTGLLAAYYAKGMDFIDSIQCILSTPITEKLKDIYSDVDTPTVAKNYLAKFIKEKETESLSDVVSNMYTPLSIFANHDVQYFFQGNAQKTSPLAVTEENKSLYLCVPEYMLHQYSAIFRLILTQSLDELTKRVSWTIPCFVLIDEAYAIGAIDNLKNKCSIARGLGVSIWLACQSLSQLRELYGNEGADIIQTNCRIKVFLECASGTADTSYIIKKAGKYHQRKTSTSFGSNGNMTVSYEQRDIFDESDLLTLVTENKEIIVTPTGVYKIKKNFWFKDKNMISIQKKLQKNNM